MDSTGLPLCFIQHHANLILPAAKLPISFNPYTLPMVIYPQNPAPSVLPSVFFDLLPLQLQTEDCSWAGDGNTDLYAMFNWYLDKEFACSQ